jgi:hypothetical protein
MLVALGVSIALLTGCSAGGSATSKPVKTAQTESVGNNPSEVQHKETDNEWVITENQLFQALESDFNTYNNQLNNPENTGQWITDTRQTTLQLEADIKSLQQHKPIGNRTTKIYGYMSPALATAQKAMKQTEQALQTEKVADVQKVEVYLNQAATQLNTANRKAMVIENTMLTESIK